MRPIFDAQWRARMLAKDESASEELCREALAPMHTFCFHRVGRNRTDCEDVVQETMVRAVREIEKYDPERSANDIFPWLADLARNEIKRLLASRPQTQSLEALWENMDAQVLNRLSKVNEEDLEEETLRREETKKVVGMAMSQLPPNLREVLIAKYVQGLSSKEIAKMWKSSERGVESVLHRARKAFQETFIALTQNLKPESE